MIKTFSMKYICGVNAYNDTSLVFDAYGNYYDCGYTTLGNYSI